MDCSVFLLAVSVGDWSADDVINKGGMTVQLEESEKWSLFYNAGNEMVISPVGRYVALFSRCLTVWRNVQPIYSVRSCNAGLSSEMFYIAYIFLFGNFVCVFSFMIWLILSMTYTIPVHVCFYSHSYETVDR